MLWEFYFCIKGQYQTQNSMIPPDDDFNPIMTERVETMYLNKYLDGEKIAKKQGWTILKARSLTTI